MSVSMPATGVVEVSLADLKRLPVVQLRELAVECQLSNEGTKVEIANRIFSYFAYIYRDDVNAPNIPNFYGDATTSESLAPKRLTREELEGATSTTAQVRGGDCAKCQKLLQKRLAKGVRKTKPWKCTHVETPSVDSANDGVSSSLDTSAVPKMEEVAFHRTDNFKREQRMNKSML